MKPKKTLARNEAMTMPELSRRLVQFEERSEALKKAEAKLQKEKEELEKLEAELRPSLEMRALFEADDAIDIASDRIAAALGALIRVTSISAELSPERLKLEKLRVQLLEVSDVVAEAINGYSAATSEEKKS